MTDAASAGTAATGVDTPVSDSAVWARRGVVGRDMPDAAGPAVASADSAAASLPISPALRRDSPTVLTSARTSAVSAAAEAAGWSDPRPAEGRLPVLDRPAGAPREAREAGDRAAPSELRDDVTDPADEEPLSAEPLSAAATPVVCGAANDNPSTTTAAPARAVLRTMRVEALDRRGVMR